jgi:hypothetical protein
MELKGLASKSSFFSSAVNVASCEKAVEQIAESSRVKISFFI